MLLPSDVFPLYPKGRNLPSTCRKNHCICFPNTLCCCSFFKPRVELHKRFFRHETALVKHRRFVINSHGRDFVFSHHLRNSQTKTPDQSYLQKLFTWSSPRNDWQRSHQLQIKTKITQAVWSLRDNGPWPARFCQDFGLFGQQDKSLGSTYVVYGGLKKYSLELWWFPLVQPVTWAVSQKRRMIRLWGL